jgi:glycosyltransferase involved in cell wall biosynthesis
VPVVGSSSGEIPNVIGDAGLVFPEGNVEALRGALAQIAASPDERRRLGEVGRRRVLDRYTQAAIAEATYRVYREMLSF